MRLNQSKLDVRKTDAKRLICVKIPFNMLGNITQGVVEYEKNRGYHSSRGVL